MVYDYDFIERTNATHYSLLLNEYVELTKDGEYYIADFPLSRVRLNPKNKDVIATYQLKAIPQLDKTAEDKYLHIDGDEDFTKLIEQQLLYYKLSYGVEGGDYFRVVNERQFTEFCKSNPFKFYKKIRTYKKTTQEVIADWVKVGDGREYKEYLAQRIIEFYEKDSIDLCRRVVHNLDK